MGPPLLDQAVDFYRRALAEAEQQKPSHRPANMAWSRYRLACGLRQRALTRYWGDAARQADLTEAKALFESIVTDSPISREAPHGYMPRGWLVVDLLGPPGSVAALDAKAALDRADAIYERLRMDYPASRLWGEDAITGTAHAVPPVATVDDEVVFHLKNRAWARSYGRTGGDYAYSLQPTRDGGFVTAGGTTSIGAATCHRSADAVRVLGRRRAGPVGATLADGPASRHTLPRACGEMLKVARSVTEHALRIAREAPCSPG